MAPHPGRGRVWAWDDDYKCYYNVAEAEAVMAGEAQMAAQVQQMFDRGEVRVVRALPRACARV